MKNRRGITLTETLMAIAIIMLLAGISWIAYAPKARSSAELTEARSRLRQIAGLIAQYAGEYDGALPLSLEPFSTTISIRDPRNGGSLMYASGSCPVHGEGSHALEDFGFNIVSDAIVRFPGVNNHAGATEMMMVPDGGGGQKPFLVPLLEPGQKVQLLGARLDGSIAWFESPAAWEENKHEHLLQLGGRQP